MIKFLIYIFFRSYDSSIDIGVSLMKDVSLPLEWPSIHFHKSVKMLIVHLKEQSNSTFLLLLPKVHADVLLITACTQVEKCRYKKTMKFSSQTLESAV